MKKQSTEKRLFLYAFRYKKGILIGLLCLGIAVFLELLGPFIAKTVIDDHILGVEGYWQEVAEVTDRYTISHDGKYFKRVDRLENTDEVVGEPVTLLQIGTSYYMIDAEAPLIGTRDAADGIITIEAGKNVYTYETVELGLDDIYAFFKPEQRPIIMLLVLYMVLLIIAGVFKFFETYLLQRTSNEIIKRMRMDLFDHIQKLPIDYFTDRPAGTIVSRITNDTEAIRDLYERVLSIIVSSIVYMVGIFVALFILDAKLAAICLLVIPLIYLWMKVYKHFGTKYNTVIRATISDINGKINEAIQGMPIIQAFNQEKNTKDEFEQLNERHYQYQKKLVRLSALTSFNLVTALRNLTFVGFIWYFGSRALDMSSVISIGMLYAFVDYITRLFEPVSDIVNQLPLVEQARVAGNRVFEVMDYEGEEVDTTEVARYRGHVQFEQVTFSYNGKDEVLKNISFEVKPGETAAFVGHTGSGKSSIMNLLFRFYDPQKGEIKIDGQPIKELSRQQVRSHMGIVLQDPFLFTGSIISNVTMNDPEIPRERAIEALKAVGAADFIEKLPNGYDETVTEGGSTFSLGERQLIAFARALAFNPAILILDEATAHMDTESESVIQQALDVLQKNRTTLIIAHRLSTIQHADRIFVLDKGSIIERGNHDTLMEDRGLYYQMHQMQQGRVRLEVS